LVDSRDWMLGLLSRKSLISASLTCLGIPGIDCMTFNTRQMSAFNINIESKFKICPDMSYLQSSKMHDKNQIRFLNNRSLWFQKKVQSARITDRNMNRITMNRNTIMKRKRNTITKFQCFSSSICLQINWETVLLEFIKTVEEPKWSLLNPQWTGHLQIST